MYAGRERAAAGPSTGRIGTAPGTKPKRKKARPSPSATPTPNPGASTLSLPSASATAQTSSPRTNYAPIPQPYLALAPAPISSMTRSAVEDRLASPSHMVLPSSYRRTRPASAAAGNRVTPDGRMQAGIGSGSGSGSRTPGPSLYSRPTGETLPMASTSGAGPSRRGYAANLLAPPLIMPGGTSATPRIQASYGGGQGSTPMSSTTNLLLQPNPNRRRAGDGTGRVAERRRSEDRLREVGAANPSMASLGHLGQILETDPALQGSEQGQSQQQQQGNTTGGQRRRRRIVRGEDGGGMARRLTVSSREEGRAIGLARGASMRRLNVWDDLPENTDAPPPFPFPTTSTARLPPTFNANANATSPTPESPSDDHSDPMPVYTASQPIPNSPPPTFEQATGLPPVTDIPPLPHSPDALIPSSSTVSLPEDASAINHTVVPSTPTVSDYASAPSSPVLSVASTGDAIEDERQDRRMWNMDLLAGYSLIERVEREAQRRRARMEADLSLARIPEQIDIGAAAPSVSGTAVAAEPVVPVEVPARDEEVAEPEQPSIQGPVTSSIVEPPTVLEAVGDSDFEGSSQTADNIDPHRPSGPAMSSSLIGLPPVAELADPETEGGQEAAPLPPSPVAESSSPVFPGGFPVPGKEEEDQGDAAREPAPTSSIARPSLSADNIDDQGFITPELQSIPVIDASKVLTGPASPTPVEEAEVAKHNDTAANVAPVEEDTSGRSTSPVPVEGPSSGVSDVQLSGDGAEGIGAKSGDRDDAHYSPPPSTELDEAPRPTTPKEQSSTIASIPTVEPASPPMVESSAKTESALQDTPDLSVDFPGPTETTPVADKPSPPTSDVTIGSPTPVRKLTRGKAIRRSSSGFKLSGQLSGPSSPSSPSSPRFPSSNSGSNAAGSSSSVRPLFSSGYTFNSGTRAHVPESPTLPSPTPTAGPEESTETPRARRLAHRASESAIVTMSALQEESKASTSQDRGDRRSVDLGRFPGRRLRDTVIAEHQRDDETEPAPLLIPEVLPPHREAALRRRESALTRSRQLFASTPIVPTQQGLRSKAKVTVIKPVLPSGPLIDLNETTPPLSPVSNGLPELRALANSTAELLQLLEEDASVPVAESSAQAAAKAAMVQELQAKVHQQQEALDGRFYEDEGIPPPVPPKDKAPSRSSTVTEDDSEAITFETPKKRVPPPLPARSSRVVSEKANGKMSIVETATSPITPRPSLRRPPAKSSAVVTVGQEEDARVPAPTRRPPPPPPPMSSLSSTTYQHRSLSPISASGSASGSGSRSGSTATPPPVFARRPPTLRAGSASSVESSIFDRSTTSPGNNKPKLRLISSTHPPPPLPLRRSGTIRPRGPRPPPPPTPRAWSKTIAESESFAHAHAQAHSHSHSHSQSQTLDFNLDMDRIPASEQRPPNERTQSDQPLTIRTTSGDLGSQAFRPELQVGSDREGRAIAPLRSASSELDLRHRSPRSPEYTDLDVLVSRLESSGREFEGYTQIASFLGPAKSPAATAEALATLLPGLISIDSRRTTKEGKVKLKLSLLGVRVTKCPICLTQFKEDEQGVLLPECGHVGHEKCARRWFREDDRCFVCRVPLLKKGEGIV